LAGVVGSTPLLTIPVFPLPVVVLFPGTHAPLHIFEPRYRQMTADALAGDRRIGMVTVRPEHAVGMEGDPPVFAIGCLGSIAEHRRLPDGRYELVLRGEQRFRLLREPPRPASQLYRTAEVELLDEPFERAEAERVGALRVAVAARLTELVRSVAPGREGDLESRLASRGDDTRFVNELCQLLDLPVPDKQGLLEAPGVRLRYEQLLGLLEFRLAELAAGSPSAGPVH
jgi:Lon protease-like protein